MILKFGMGEGHVYPPTEYGYREVDTVAVNCRKLKELKENFIDIGIIETLCELVPGNEKYNINDMKIIINPYNGIAQELYDIYIEDTDRDNDEFTKNRVRNLIDSNENNYKSLIIFFEKKESDNMSTLFYYGFIIGEPLYVMNNQGKTIDFYSGN